MSFLWGLIPRVHPRILLYVCPHGIVPTKPHVTSFTITWTTFEAFEDICLDYLRCWTTRISLIALNLLWYIRPWLTNIKLIDGSLLILTSTSVYRHTQSQTINKDEGTASCVMTHCLTQLLAACKCDDCPVTIAQSLIQVSIQHHRVWLHIWTL